MNSSQFRLLLILQIVTIFLISVLFLRKTEPAAAVPNEPPQGMKAKEMIEVRVVL
jgi:hypothetical protein